MRSRPFFAALLCFLGLTAPAVAHHAMDGSLPVTFMDGLVSGLLHPVIGPDHFLGIVAVGLLSLGVSRGEWLAIAFVAASVLGTGLHLASVDVPAAEALVAGTVIVFGALVLALRSPEHRAWLGRLLPVALTAGTLHGYAYGESIVGAGASSLVAYLIGFCVAQAAVVLGVRRVCEWISAKGLSTIRLRTISGAVVSLGGLLLITLALAS
jgi:urease accessory protein